MTQRYVVDTLLEPVRKIGDQTEVVYLEPADAYRLTLPQTYRFTSRRRARRYAAFAAICAGARVEYRVAERLTRTEHWRPGGRNVLIVPESVPRPVPILPFVDRAVSEMLEDRRDDDNPLMFLYDHGTPMRHGHSSFILGLYAFGRQIAVGGTSMYRALLRMFDDCIDDEQADREAASVLSGNRYLVRDFDPTTDEVSDRRLKKVLFERHPLSRPDHCYDAEWLAAAPTRLPPTPTRQRRKISGAMVEDATVAGLAAEVWPEEKAEIKKRSRDLTKDHFPHLDELRRVGKLTRREIMFLLKIDDNRYSYLVRTRRIALAAVPKVTRPRIEWEEIIPRVYVEGGFPAKSFHAFLAHLQTTEGCRLDKRGIKEILRAAGHLRRQRGRPRKYPGRTKGTNAGAAAVTDGRRTPNS